MLFMHTWQQVIDGSKTATRRLWVDSDYTWVCGLLSGDIYAPSIYSEIVKQNHKPRYQVGQVIPVMPARGVKNIKKVADFKIATLWRHDVRKITASDARKEGFERPDLFLQTWCKMHDPDVLEQWRTGLTWTQATIGAFLAALNERPRERYMATVIEWEWDSVNVYPLAATEAVLQLLGGEDSPLLDLAAAAKKATKAVNALASILPPSTNELGA